MNVSLHLPYTHLAARGTRRRTIEPAAHDVQAILLAAGDTS